MNLEGCHPEILIAYLLGTELSPGAWHCGSATVLVRAGTQPAVPHPQHGDPVTFFKLSLFILTAQPRPIVREVTTKRTRRGNLPLFEASWSTQLTTRRQTEVSCAVPGSCFKGGALSSFSLSNCFTGQHLERQNMSASLPHRPLGRLRTALCALFSVLKPSRCICVCGRAINRANYGVSGIWVRGSQAVCLWDRGRGRKEGCGKAGQEGVTAQTPCWGIFVLLSFWPSFSTRTTFVAGILTGEV